MIIKRLAENIKKQDWFVVTIEIMIVVIGIFIGLQVDDWNKARLDDAKSERYTDQLIVDLHEELYIIAYVLAYNEDVLQNAEAALRVLTNKTEMGNEEFLINMFRASQYTWLAKTQMTLEELVSTGQVDLIKSTQLRSFALAVYHSPLLQLIEIRGRESPYREMFRSLIPMDVLRSLKNHCGDFPIQLGDYEILDKLLSLECELELPQSAIEFAATALKADPKLVSKLRLRVATLDSQVAELRRDGDFKALSDYLKTQSDP